MSTPIQRVREDHQDPLTGEPGAHPVTTGIGAAIGGAVAGAAAGALAGPVGAVVGAVVGGVSGGLAGKATGEAIDPTREEAYWRDNYAKTAYYTDDTPFETVESAYRYGWESRSKFADRDFVEVEADLQRDWEKIAEKNRLDWNKAKLAARDAWERVDRVPSELENPLEDPDDVKRSPK